MLTPNDNFDLHEDMMKMLHNSVARIVACLGCVILMQTTIWAVAIDLSGFITDNSFDFAGGQGAGNWVVAAGGMSVTQVVNGDSTMFLSPNSFSNSTISGTFSESSGDDDFVGFVFGFQDTGSFYLFDWKQGTQSAYSASALRGITLKRFDAMPTLQGHLWATDSVDGIMTQLFYQDVSRLNGIIYTFELTFTSPQISIGLFEGETELANFTVSDGTYSTGRFGFYNFSEDNVTYTGFTADPAPPAIPEPSTLFYLLGGGSFLEYGQADCEGRESSALLAIRRCLCR